MQELKQEQIERGERASFDVDVKHSASVEGAEKLHDTLAEMADTFDVTGFKCVKCGLVHMHDTTKHRLSDTFDSADDVTGDMEYNSVCHCGLQESARRGFDFSDEASVRADKAPIPEESFREMNEKYGSL